MLQVNRTRVSINGTQKEIFENITQLIDACLDNNDLTTLLLSALVAKAEDIEKAIRQSNQDDEDDEDCEEDEEEFDEHSIQLKVIHGTDLRKMLDAVIADIEKELKEDDEDDE